MTTYKNYVKVFSIVLAFIVLAVGCTPSVAPDAPTETGEPSETPEQQTPTAGESPLSEGMVVASPLYAPDGASDEAMPEMPAEAQKLLKKAASDLMERENLNPTQVEVVEVEAVEWNDSSLGCPEEGKMYAQVITPGYRIVFETPEGRKVYHTDGGDQVVFCESGEPQSILRDFPSDGPIVEAARTDLAQRLDLSLEQIEVIGVIGQNFTVHSFSCQSVKEQAQIARDEAPTMPGRTILLEAKGKRYEYHANDKQIVFCRSLS